ncbi:MAG: hypothetical protein LIP01_11000 [Tannerellaceae bacterium]|nr:hypothetical protein [Tannerellaceae bacterium]
MRTIEEIKDTMATDFMQNDEVAKKFEFATGEKFSDYFSKVSIINILFYIVSVSIWLLEKLFEAHQQDVNHQIEEILPHRVKWYRDKALNFLKGVDLIEETDRFDTHDMTEEQIEEARVIKHAVAAELKNLSVLQIKVAGEVKEKNENGEEIIRRVPLDAGTESELEVYLSQIKDAGVYVQVVNSEPDLFRCSVRIYYNPMIAAETVKNNCHQTIVNYIENLPFNGEYTNMELTNLIQAVEGVKITYLKDVEKKGMDDEDFMAIQVRATPHAGYYKADKINLEMKPYEQLSGDDRDE